MIIDRMLLRWARAENLDRLARWLKVDLPPIPPSGYRREEWRAKAATVLERAITVQAVIDAARAEGRAA